MKSTQNHFFTLFNVASLILTVSLWLPNLANAAAPVDFASVPLANSPTVTIEPNLLFIMDDSGSMKHGYMPNYVNGYSTDLKTDADFNPLAYNPAVTYTPPAYFDANGLNTTKYPSMDGTVKDKRGAVDWASKPNWRRVKKDGYGELSTGTTDLENLNSGAGPKFWVTLPVEYCTKADLKSCVTQYDVSDTHPFPAPFRWCVDAASATATTPPGGDKCQRVRSSTFDTLRQPGSFSPGVSKTQATITVTSAVGDVKLSSLTVGSGGDEIMKNPTTNSSNDLQTLAKRIRNKINGCTNQIQQNCTTAGYSATYTGNVVTITAPAPTTATPILTVSQGTMTADITPFVTTAPVAGGRTEITIDRSSGATYAYPGTALKHPARTDCAGSVCTYEEEMTNYANWFAYYQTRMQLMKTATSLAFKNIGDDFKLGFMTINVASSKSLNIAKFDTAHKAAWYKELFETPASGGTPSRRALSRAGRIYAAKETVGSVFTDPIDYECQQNFTLLTTDGGWKDTDGYEVNTSYKPGDQDGNAVPPYKDASKTGNLLSDYAKYYRDTDLRTPDGNNSRTDFDNCTNPAGRNICGTAATATQTAKDLEQTMVTMTLGMGVNGELAYETDYKTSTTGDFAQIRDGTKPWPSIDVADFDEGTLPSKIDDLWHTAVNGDGTYFSANKPNELVRQLQRVINEITVKVGAGAAAATSTLNPVSGDNYAYVASYVSGKWKGNLEKRAISTTTGEVSKVTLKAVDDVLVENSCSGTNTGIQNISGTYYCVTTGVTNAANCDTTDVNTTYVGTECRVKVDVNLGGSLREQMKQTTRTILFNEAGTDGTLEPFEAGRLTAAQTATMDPTFLEANLSQGISYTQPQKDNLSIDNLVNYLKGSTEYDENSSDGDKKIFRAREGVLGDLIDSKPEFVGRPVFNYGDPGYQDFKTANASRAGTVYVGSNDGMLHAFDADTLEERWAFIPSEVIPNLWKLADINYSAKHTYYVNGDVTISDICVAANCATATQADWRTILIGGLESGGRAYYALDVTDPTAPKLLWEINPSVTGFEQLGYTFGNPIITKRNVDGKWVALLTSGYNNIPDDLTSGFYSQTSTKFKPIGGHATGDGVGRLYVVDAFSGSLLDTISTTGGSVTADATAPNGLAKITAFAFDAEVNNAVTYVYGGDLNGDIWRFNIDLPAAANVNKVMRYATLRGGSAAFPTIQPITTIPELGEIGSKPVLFVGTGKYLETSDLTDTSQQTLYAIQDKEAGTLASTTFVNPRASLIKQTIQPRPGTTNERESGTANANAPFSGNRGWYVDLPDSGERQNVASQLVLGTLLVPTTVPTSSACNPAGFGWFNYLDYKTGRAVVVASGVVSQRTDAPSVGFNTVYVDGTPKVSNVEADDQNPKLLDKVPFSGSASGFQLKRSIWREIIEN